MKKLLLSVATTMFYFLGISQVGIYTPVTVTTHGLHLNRALVDSGLSVPFTGISRNGSYIRPGLLLVNTADSNFYYGRGGNNFRRVLDENDLGVTVTDVYRRLDSVFIEYGGSVEEFRFKIDTTGGSGTGWSLTGNTAIDTSINFLGTTDNKFLGFRTYGVEHVRIDSGGQMLLHRDASTYPKSLLRIAGGFGDFQYTDGNEGEGKVLVSTTDGAAYWSDNASAFTIPINKLANATGAGTIGLGAQQQAWTWNDISTQNGLALYSTGANAAANAQTLFRLSMSGTNTNSSQTTYAQMATNAHGGTNATNVAAAFSAVGGTNNYAILVPPSSGKVGIGTNNPDKLFTVNGVAKITDSLYLTSLPAGGAAADSVLVVTSTGNVKRRDAATFGSSGSTSTLQQVLDAGNSATQNINLTGTATITDSLILTGIVEGGISDDSLLVVSSDGTVKKRDGSLVGNNWSLTGNAGTNPSTNYIGTTDAQPLIIRIKGGVAGKIDLSNGDGAGLGNISLGVLSLPLSATGINNVAIGTNAMFGNTTGELNTVVGTAALSTNTTGNQNTVVGANAMSAGNSTGSTAIGRSALDRTSGGNYNVGIGYNAGDDNTSGGRNIFIGSFSQNENSAGTGSRNVVIGDSSFLASGTGSNQLNIMNYIYGTGLSGKGTGISQGKIGLGVKAPDSNLTVNGGIMVNALRVISPIQRSFDSTNYKIGVLASNGTINQMSWPTAAQIGGATSASLASYVPYTDSSTIFGTRNYNQNTFLPLSAGRNRRLTGGLYNTSQTVTAADTMLSLYQIWNNASVGFYGINMSITNTASSAGNSRLISLNVGGNEQFGVDETGRLRHTNGTVITFGGQFTFGTTAANWWRINTSGNLIANDDSTRDIGATLATRPRNEYLAGKLEIGTGTASSKAKLQVMSTTQGVLLSLMSTTNRDAIASSVTGLTVYDTTAKKYSVFNSVTNQWLYIPPAFIGTTTLDFPSTLPAGTSDLTFTVTGAVIGDQVMITTGASATYPAAGIISGFVSSANTITARYSNTGSISSIDLGNQTYNYQVVKQ